MALPRAGAKNLPSALPVPVMGREVLPQLFSQKVQYPCECAYWRCRTYARAITTMPTTIR